MSETWIGKAGAVVGDLVLAMLIVTMVPLALMVVITSVFWLVGAMVAMARGV